MNRSIYRLASLVAFLVAILSAPAHADAVLGFYSHGWGLGRGGFLYFPHAFITVEPLSEDALKSDASAARPLIVYRSYGFTTAEETPDALLRHTRGKVIDSARTYLALSHRQFAVRITDAQYRDLMSAEAAWEAVGGDSYDLHRRNCISFVAAMARAIGLSVGDDRSLDPVKFLTDLRARNAARLLPETAPTAPASPVTPPASPAAQ